MRLRIRSAACAVLVFLFSCAFGAETNVSVAKRGDVFIVDANSTVASNRATAWRVLTDYEGYPSFVPNLSLSRLVSLDPRRVEQRGEFGILFFTKEIFATFDIQEWPRSKIRFRALEGNVKMLETEVTMEGEDRNLTIRYRSVIEPDFWVPPLIGAPILRSSIRGKLQAVAEEIERRAAVAATK